MRHRFIEDLSQRLAELGVATMRYQFPYMEKRVKRPDSEGVLIATVQAALTAAEKYSDGLPIFAGGKSMGGRMTSLTLAKAPHGQAAWPDFFWLSAACAGSAVGGTRQTSS